MASESTAIHDFLAGLQQKSLPDDPDDDLLFAGSQPRRQARGTEPPPRMFEERAPAVDPAAAVSIAAPAVMSHGSGPRVVPLPKPFQNMPAAGISHQHNATVRVQRQAAASNKKVYAIAAGLFVAVVALLGVYLSGGDDKPAAVASAAADRAETGDRAEAETTEPSAKPTVEPIEKPTVEPIEEAATARVEPIEDVAAAAAATDATAAVEAAAPAAPAAPVAAAAPAPAAAAAAPAAVAAAPTSAVVAAVPAPAIAAAVTLPRDAVAPPEVVPASAFVASSEQTVPTVPTATLAAAPAPVVTAPAATVASAPVKVAKKSKRELARERRAAKRAAKRAKQRVSAKKSVARAEVAAKSDAKLRGNGALQISSAQPREVWVDGRNSKRMTPLRVLLKPGKHKVTLFDKAKGTAKTFDVEIKPNETTKVAK